MNFNRHLDLEGRHAFLGASKYSWLNYTDEKLKETYFNQRAKLRGIELHDFASRCIRLGQKLPASKKTLNMFVNDAIGYRMQSEQVLFYSENCFGTADAISFKDKTKKLRIHDLKTGITPSSMNQLMIYAAIFCLEYSKDPHELSIELRIYQNDEIEEYIPEATEILLIMQRIRDFDKMLDELKEEEFGWN